MNIEGRISDFELTVASEERSDEAIQSVLQHWAASCLAVTEFIVNSKLLTLNS